MASNNFNFLKNGVNRLTLSTKTTTSGESEIGNPSWQYGEHLQYVAAVADPTVLNFDWSEEPEEDAIQYNWGRYDVGGIKRNSTLVTDPEYDMDVVQNESGVFFRNHTQYQFTIYVFYGSNFNPSTRVEATAETDAESVGYWVEHSILSPYDENSDNSLTIPWAKDQYGNQSERIYLKLDPMVGSPSIYSMNSGEKQAFDLASLNGDDDKNLYAVPQTSSIISQNTLTTNMDEDTFHVSLNANEEWVVTSLRNNEGVLYYEEQGKPDNFSYNTTHSVTATGGLATNGYLLVDTPGNKNVIVRHSSKSNSNNIGENLDSTLFNFTMPEKINGEEEYIPTKVVFFATYPATGVISGSGEGSFISGAIVQGRNINGELLTTYTNTQGYYEFSEPVYGKITLTGGENLMTGESYFTDESDNDAVVTTGGVRKVNSSMGGTISPISTFLVDLQDNEGLTENEALDILVEQGPELFDLPSTLARKDKIKEYLNLGLVGFQNSEDDSTTEYAGFLSFSKKIAEQEQAFVDTNFSATASKETKELALNNYRKSLTRFVKRKKDDELETFKTDYLTKAGSDSDVALINMSAPTKKDQFYLVIADAIEETDANVHASEKLSSNKAEFKTKAKEMMEDLVDVSEGVDVTGLDYESIAVKYNEEYTKRKLAAREEQYARYQGNKSSLATKKSQQNFKIEKETTGYKRSGNIITKTGQAPSTISTNRQLTSKRFLETSKISKINPIIQKGGVEQQLKRTSTGRLVTEVKTREEATGFKIVNPNLVEVTSDATGFTRNYAFHGGEHLRRHIKGRGISDTRVAYSFYIVDKDTNKRVPIEYAVGSLFRNLADSFVTLAQSSSALLDTEVHEHVNAWASVRDTDGDGVIDTEDLFPNDPTRSSIVPMIIRFRVGDSSYGNGSLTLKTYFNNLNAVDIHWGDGDENGETFTGSRPQHTYASAGDYTVKFYFKGTEYWASNNRSFVSAGDSYKLISIEQWGDFVWNSSSMIWGEVRANVNATDVPTLTETFTGFTKSTFTFSAAATAAWENIDLSPVRNMGSLFASCYSDVAQFGIDKWDVSQVTNMSTTFSQRSPGDLIRNWNTSNVTDMSSMFASSSIGGDTLKTKVVNLGQANEYIAWDVSKVTNFTGFSSYGNAGSGTLDISNWQINTSAPVSMGNMFYRGGMPMEDLAKKTVTLENGTSYEAWNTSQVTNIQGMFYRASTGDLNIDNASWETGNMTTMQDFHYSYSGYPIPHQWDRDISGWDLSALTNKDLGLFNYNNMDSAKFSTENYDKILKAWDAAGYTDITVNFGKSQYSADPVYFYWPANNNSLARNRVRGGSSQDLSKILNIGDLIVNEYTGISATVIGFDSSRKYEAIVDVSGFVGAGIGQRMASYSPTTSGGFIARHNLINKGWTITDGDSNKAFASTELELNVEAGQVFRMTFHTGSNTHIDFGDGNGWVESTNYYKDSQPYPSSGIVTLKINQTNADWFWGIDMKDGANNTTSRSMITKVLNWGSNIYTETQAMFDSCSNLSSIPVDSNGLAILPDFRGAHTLNRLFINCDLTDIDFSNWLTSNITDVSYMFSGNTDFLGNGLENWNTTNLTNIAALLQNTKFNKDISGWDVSNVTNFSCLFKGATLFDQDISAWDTGSATDLSAMFSGATAFNQDINTKVIGTGSDAYIAWDTSNNENWNGMFKNAAAFNTPIDKWEIAKDSSTQGMTFMFGQNCGFTHDLLTKDVTIGAGTSLEKTYVAWDVKYIKTFGYGYASPSYDSYHGMFENNTTFNGDISNWDLMESFPVGDRAVQRMFVSASSFNRDINTKTITDVVGKGTYQAWDISGMTSIHSMLTAASSFNQNVGNWDISNLTKVGSALQYTGLDNENYDKILQGWGSQSVNSGIIADFSSVKYTPGGSAEASRQSLVDTGWTITDGGPAAYQFTYTIDTTLAGDSLTQRFGTGLYNHSQTQAQLVLNDENVKIRINWGDGSGVKYYGKSDSIEGRDLYNTQRYNFEHTYSAHGTYQIRVSYEDVITAYPTALTQPVPQGIQGWVYGISSTDWSKRVTSIDSWGEMSTNRLFTAHGLYMHLPNCQSWPAVDTSLITEVTAGTYGAPFIASAMGNILHTARYATSFNASDWNLTQGKDNKVIETSRYYNRFRDADRLETLNLNGLEYDKYSSAWPDDHGYFGSLVPNGTLVGFNDITIDQDGGNYNSAPNNAGGFQGYLKGRVHKDSTFNNMSINNATDDIWRVNPTNISDIITDDSTYTFQQKNWIDTSGDGNKKLKVKNLPSFYLKGTDGEARTSGIDITIDLTSPNGWELNGSFLRQWQYGPSSTTLAAGTKLTILGTGNWDTSNVTNWYQFMYYQPSTIILDMDISSWSFEGSPTDVINSFSLPTLTSEQYTKALIAWAASEPSYGATINLGSAQYDYSAHTAKMSLVNDYGWTITDAGNLPIPMKMTVRVGDGSATRDDGSLSFTTGHTTEARAQSYTIEWGDGNTGDQDNNSHTYASAGDYQITIEGTYDPEYCSQSNHSGKVISIDQWGDSDHYLGGITGSSYGAFQYCYSMDVLAEDACLIHGTSMRNLFSHTDALQNTNGSLNLWDTSAITDMSGVFGGGSQFNGDISYWKTDNVTTMASMFAGRHYRGPYGQFNGDINTKVRPDGTLAWNTASLESINRMFVYQYAFQGSISNWNTDSLTDMNYFRIPYTGTITWPNNNMSTKTVTVGDQSYIAWDVSNVTVFGGAFGVNGGGTEANGISNWNISSSNGNLAYMFSGATTSDTSWDLSTREVTVGDRTYTAWDTGNITDMSYMFKSFKGGNDKLNEITNWDMSSVENLDSFAMENSTFNQDLSNWNTSSLKTAMSFVRQGRNGITPLDTSLAGWDISKMESGKGITGWTAGYGAQSSISTANYDATLISFASQNITSGISLEFGSSQYTPGGAVATARQTLVDAGVTITDGGAAPLKFKFTTELPEGQTDFTIQPQMSGSQVEINWGDGNTEIITGNTTHTYASTGPHEISISPIYNGSTFEGFNGWDTNNIKNTTNTILQWGDVEWENNYWFAFPSHSNGAWKVHVPAGAENAPDLSRVTSLSNMFRGPNKGARLFEDLYNNLTTWDVSTITDMSYMFGFGGAQTTKSNGEANILDLTGWNVSNVTNFTYFLYGSYITANGPQTNGLGADMTGWDTSSATNMSYMLSCKGPKTGYVNFDTSNVTNMSSMFLGVKAYGGDGITEDISTKMVDGTLRWSVSKVTNFANFADKATFGSAAWENFPANWRFNPDATFSLSYFAYEALDGNFTDENLFATKTITQDWYGGSSYTAWDMTNCSNLNRAFHSIINNDTYNPQIDTWNITSNMTDISGLISDTSGYVAGMTGIDRDISGWDFSGLTANGFGVWAGNSRYPGGYVTRTFSLSVENYDALLISLESQSTSFTSMYMGESQYTSGGDAEAAKNTLLARGITITDGGVAPLPFKMKIVTTEANETFTYSTSSSSSNAKTVWGDGETTKASTGDTHTYATPGEYIIEIHPTGFKGFGVWGADIRKVREVQQWGDIEWENNSWFHQTGVQHNIYGTQVDFDVTATDTPNLSGVTSLQNMFAVLSNRENEVFSDPNGSLANWDVSTIIDMSSMFYGISGAGFVTDLNNWDTSNVRQMTSMFSFYKGYDSVKSNPNISDWDVSNVHNFAGMFSKNSGQSSDLSNWNTSSATNMLSMFSESSAASNSNLLYKGNGIWDTSNVTQFNLCFGYGGSVGTHGVYNWKTDSATSMYGMFLKSTSMFNLLTNDLDHLNTKTETVGSESYTAWNIGNVTTLESFLSSATASSLDLDFTNWDTSNVTSIKELMYDNNPYISAPSMDRDLSGWDIGNLTNMTNFIYNNQGQKAPTFSTENYNAIMDAWGSGNFEDGLTVNFGNSFVVQGSAGAAGRQNLLDGGWTITDGGEVENIVPMKIKLKGISGQTVTLPAYSNNANWTVVWGDGNEDKGTGGTSIFNYRSHTYAEGVDEAIVEIGKIGDGTRPDKLENRSSWSPYIEEVIQWGDTEWSKMTLKGAANLTTIPQESIFTLKDEGDMSAFFQDCTLFTGENVNWGLWQQVIDNSDKNLTSMFKNALNFNGDISGWDTSNVENMSSMFYDALEGSMSFTQDISGWDVSAVTSFDYMFYGNSVSINYSLENWVIRSNASMVSAFRYASAWGSSGTHNVDTVVGWAVREYNSRTRNVNVNLATAFYSFGDLQWNGRKSTHSTSENSYTRHFSNWPRAWRSPDDAINWLTLDTEEGGAGWTIS